MNNQRAQHKLNALQAENIERVKTLSQLDVTLWHPLELAEFRMNWLLSLMVEKWGDEWGIRVSIQWEEIMAEALQRAVDGQQTKLTIVGDMSDGEGTAQSESEADTETGSIHDGGSDGSETRSDDARKSVSEEVVASGSQFENPEQASKVDDVPCDARAKAEYLSGPGMRSHY